MCIIDTMHNCTFPCIFVLYIHLAEKKTRKFVYDNRNKRKRASLSWQENRGRTLTKKNKTYEISSIHAEHMYILFVYMCFLFNPFKNVHSSKCRFLDKDLLATPKKKRRKKREVFRKGCARFFIYS